MGMVGQGTRPTRRGDLHTAPGSFLRNSSLQSGLAYPEQQPPPQQPRAHAAPTPVAEEQEATAETSQTAQAPEPPRSPPPRLPPARLGPSPGQRPKGAGLGRGRGEPPRLNGRRDQPHIPTGPRDAAARPEVNNRGPASLPLRAPCTALRGPDALLRGGRFPPSPQRPPGPEQRQRARRPESAGRAHRQGSGARSLPAPTARCGAAGIWRGPGRYLRTFQPGRPAALG